MRSTLHVESLFNGDAPTISSLNYLKPSSKPKFRTIGGIDHSLINSSDMLCVQDQIDKANQRANMVYPYRMDSVYNSPEAVKNRKQCESEFNSKNSDIFEWRSNCHTWSGCIDNTEIEQDESSRFFFCSDDYYHRHEQAKTLDRVASQSKPTDQTINGSHDLCAPNNFLGTKSQGDSSDSIWGVMLEKPSNLPSQICGKETRHRRINQNISKVTPMQIPTEHCMQHENTCQTEAHDSYYSVNLKSQNEMLPNIMSDCLRNVNDGINKYDVLTDILKNQANLYNMTNGSANESPELSADVASGENTYCRTDSHRNHIPFQHTPSTTAEFNQMDIPPDKLLEILKQLRFEDFKLLDSQHFFPAALILLQQRRRLSEQMSNIDCFLKNLIDSPNATPSQQSINSHDMWRDQNERFEQMQNQQLESSDRVVRSNNDKTFAHDFTAYEMLNSENKHEGNSSEHVPNLDSSALKNYYKNCISFFGTCSPPYQNPSPCPSPHSTVASVNFNSDWPSTPETFDGYFNTNSNYNCNVDEELSTPPSRLGTRQLISELSPGIGDYAQVLDRSCLNGISEQAEEALDAIHSSKDDIFDRIAVSLDGLKIDDKGLDNDSSAIFNHAEHKRFRGSDELLSDHPSDSKMMAQTKNYAMHRRSLPDILNDDNQEKPLRLVLEKLVMDSKVASEDSMAGDNDNKAALSNVANMTKFKHSNDSVYSRHEKMNNIGHKEDRFPRPDSFCEFVDYSKCSDISIDPFSSRDTLHIVGSNNDVRVSSIGRQCSAKERATTNCRREKIDWSTARNTNDQNGEKTDTKALASSSQQYLLHIQANCKPCAFYYNKQKRCKNGDLCEFCHHEDHSRLTLKQWKKQQQRVLRHSSSAGSVRGGMDSLSLHAS